MKAGYAMPRIAKIVVEISLGREFDYLIPERLDGQIQLGSRVLAPFRHSVARGYVVGFADHSACASLKEIQDLIGARPLLTPIVLRLARWMSEYYCCTLEQAIRTVLPCAIRRAGARHRSLLYVEPTRHGQRPAGSPALRGAMPRATVEQLRAEGAQSMADFMRRTRATRPRCGRWKKTAGCALRKRTAERNLSNIFALLNILPTQPLELFPEQIRALELARRAIDTHDPPVVLPYGVTGSARPKRTCKLSNTPCARAAAP